MNNPLKELDQIYASEEIKKQTLNYVINCKHYSNLLLLVPLCVCVLLFGIFIFPKDGKIVPVAYVSLDINPSLELQLDAKDIVIKVVTYNQEDQRVIDKLTLTGVKLQAAILTLLSDEQYNDYLQNGLLEVSVFANNQSLSSNLEITLNNLLSKQLGTNRYHCSQVDQETHHNASSHHMSAGKYQIIETIMSYTSQYSFAELNQFSVQELYNILAIFNQEEVPEGCQPGYNQDSHHRKNHNQPK